MKIVDAKENTVPFGTLQDGDAFECERNQMVVPLNAELRIL